MLITLLVFILVLSVLVLIHELGHFLVAKIFKIKVEEFGFGFPPKVFGIRRGETLYTLNLFPFGGFVKLYGEDEAGGGRITNGKLPVLADSPGKIENGKLDVSRAYFARPAWQRFMVVLAGVVMNTLLAFIIFYIFISFSSFKTILPLLSDHKFSNVNQTNYNINQQDAVVSVVVPNSPAGSLQMKLPAQMLSVNDEKIDSREEFVKIINENKGKEVVIAWKELQSGEVNSAKAIPRKNPPKNEGSLGVAFFPVALLRYDTVSQKALSGISYSYDLLTYTFDVMGKLIASSIKSGDARPVGESVSGPIGVYSIVGEVLKIKDLKEKTLGILNLAGALSVSLAFFNVLPIPALDGGRLFFIIIELVTRRRVNARIESMAHAIGLAVLMGLLVLITVFDISKLF